MSIVFGQCDPSSSVETGSCSRPICAICGHVLGRKLIAGVCHSTGSYDIYFCDSCRVGSIIPFPSQDSLARLYSAGSYRMTTGKRFNAVIEFFILLSRRLRKRRIEKYAVPGALLDIGCGRGLFLDLMRRGGWKVTGYEYDQETADSLSALHGFPVLSGDFASMELPDGSFDVVTLSHVIEHVPDPSSMIAVCRRLLKKGGLLVVATPNILSLQGRAGGSSWFHLDVPYHIHHFSREGLIRLLEGNAFEVKTVRDFDMEHNPFGWLQTLLNLSGIEHNLLYRSLMDPALRGSGFLLKRKNGFILSLALLPFYMPLAILLSLAESLMRHGGTVEVHAIKHSRLSPREVDIL